MSLEPVESVEPVEPGEGTRRRLPCLSMHLIAVAMAFCVQVGEPLCADVVINELSAAGRSGLTDEDGDDSDWIELFNAGPGVVDLAGSFLTDDRGDPTRWSFPAVDETLLSPGDYLVVFASGKDRREGLELHTSFRLTATGEYLGLFAADGRRVVHEFAPLYPRQVEGVTYGLASVTETFLAPGSDTRWLVPTSGALEAVWRRRDFTPGVSWATGATGLGFDTGAGDAAFPVPISVWNLDGDYRDSVGSNHGTASGSPGFVEGHEGDPDQAVDLSGSNHVSIAQNDRLPAYDLPAYTISMWVKGMPQADKRVFSEGSGADNTPLFTIGTHRSGSNGAVDIFLRPGPGHVISERQAFDGVWHHICWTDEGGDAALYVDGVRDPVDFRYAKQAMALDITSIGAVLRASACCGFEGRIDAVAIWDEVLTVADIADLANGVSPLGGSAYRRYIATDVESEMAGENATLWSRTMFQVDDASVFDTLSLRTRYNDGFVASLNGVEVASRNAPATPRWNSVATGVRSTEESIVPEALNLSAFVGLLDSGTNVLSIHGLNREVDDGDFLLDAELTASGSLALTPRYLATPTPGGANEDDFIDFVADTVFSVDRGFHDDPFDVEITTETVGAQIRYTTDGSAPTLTQGEIYDGPIRVDTTTTLRAAAFRSGWEPTNVDTHTYLFLDDVIRQPARPEGYPATWAGYRADYAMDPQICTNTGSASYQPTIKDDLRAIPTMSIVMTRDDFVGSSRGIYTHPQSRGVAWERPCSVELFTADGSEPGFQIDAGVRQQGGSSARAIEGKHSFRLLFKSIYGASKLRYRLFPDSDVARFDTLVLRCFSTDSWHFKDGGARYRRWDSQYIRDVWMRDTQIAMGLRGQHSRYVHLYVNGLYWGIYNPTERSDDHHNAHYYGGASEDWDVVKDFNELFRGNRAAWSNFMSQAGSGLASRAAYQRIQGRNLDGTRNPAYPVQLELDNLIDYMVLHLYACSEDWPHHNWYAARNRTGEFGGWRFFPWDQEIVMDFQFRNRINVANGNSPAYVYNALRANPEFRVRFADRVHRHLFNDGVLTNEVAAANYMRRANEIDRAIVGESARWGDFRVDRRDPSNSPAELYTREDHWLPERDTVIEEYIPESRDRALSRFRSASLYPVVDAPTFNRRGGFIDEGFRLTMSAVRGTIYYTLDGTDPRLVGGGTSVSAHEYGSAGLTTLLASGAPARALVPSSDALGLGWTEPDFDDSSWAGGTTGVGYERTSGYEELIGLDVRDEMDRVNGSVYIRVPFAADDVAGIESLALRMKYDDGFIAYINGHEVARRNAPADARWDSRATSPHSDSAAVVFEQIDITEHLGHVGAGSNLLAIHGLNSSVGSSDCLLLPEIASSATLGDSDVILGESTLVRARSRDGELWSALDEVIFTVDRGLRITEIMYHPAAPQGEGLFEQDEYEFIELTNVGDVSIDLTGVRFVEGIEFDFTDGAVPDLSPGEVVVLVENLEAFASRYDLAGILVAGVYDGKLANDGERLLLVGPLDEELHDFEFADTWHPATDGGGPSLVAAVPASDPTTWADAATWRPSELPLGSPGIDEAGGAGGGLQRAGDANQDGRTDVSDVVASLRRLFAGAPATLPCGDGSATHAANRALLDLNGDSVLDLSDTVYLLGYLFQAGAAPASGVGCIRIEGCPDACVR